MLKILLGIWAVINDTQFICFSLVYEDLCVYLNTVGEKKTLVISTTLSANIHWVNWISMLCIVYNRLFTGAKLLIFSSFSVTAVVDNYTTY